MQFVAAKPCHAEVNLTLHGIEQVTYVRQGLHGGADSC